jgi:hypothetical protein
MKKILLALTLLSTVSGIAAPALRQTISVNLPLTFIDDISVAVPISEHCSVVSYEVGAVMGEYSVRTYAVGQYFHGKKLIQESIDMRITDDAHIWCVLPAKMTVKELEKELNFK